jgi:2,3-bisphosphoglycerate-dependent phosphoglycerate mutase
LKEYRQHRFERPQGATEILLVRHGESQPASPDQPFPLIDGQGDPPLGDVGTAQAELVGQRLRHLPIDSVYVTSLRRTRETAAPLCAHLGLTPEVKADLREVHLGDWEGGLFRIRAHEQDPIFLQMQEEERWDVIPGAESLARLQQRVQRGLDEISASHPDKLVVAVVHGGVIGHIIARATGATAFAFNGADNGSVSHIVMHAGKIIVRSFNDACHLVNNQS